MYSLMKRILIGKPLKSQAAGEQNYQKSKLWHYCHQTHCRQSHTVQNKS